MYMVCACYVGIAQLVKQVVCTYSYDLRLLMSCDFVRTWKQHPEHMPSFTDSGSWHKHVLISRALGQPCRSWHEVSRICHFGGGTSCAA